MPPGRNRRLAGWLVLAAFFISAGGLWWLAERSSNIRFLPALGPAQWILYPTPPDGDGNPWFEFTTEFRRSFFLDKAPSNAALDIRALERYSILINDRDVGTPFHKGRNWKQPDRYEIAGLLRAGTNEISIVVRNEAGPPALWLLARADNFALLTDRTWQASLMGAVWEPASLATSPPLVNPGSPLYGGENSIVSLRKRLPLILLFAALSGFMLAAGRWWWARSQGRDAQPSYCSPAKCMVASVGALALAWAALWLNNLGSLPPVQGFDAPAHLEYIRYILNRRTLPLANEGFEMYQPPLYYLVAAAQLALLHAAPFGSSGVAALRLFGLVCGVATVSLVFLSLRQVFPGQPRRQLFGLLLAGFLPANLYLYQYVTNEILETTLVAASIYLCLRILADPSVLPARYAWLGICLGAALLAKSSALVAVPLIVAAVGWNLWTSQISSARQVVGCIGLMLLCCLGVSGWHYCRAAMHFHNPVIGNWDIASGFHWWQHPGYQTAAYYAAFGKSLISPFYGGFTGFADGVYSTLWGDGLWGGQTELNFRPPWNWDLMAAGYLFALLPSCAIIVGAVLSFIRFMREPRTEGFLILGLIWLVMVLLVYYSLKVPSYAASKAFYGSAALVPLCVLGATGWDFLIQKAGRLRFGLYLVLGIWAMTSYASFWIRKGAPYTQITMARDFSFRGNHDSAAVRLSQVLKLNPKNATAAKALALEKLEQGRLEEARTAAEQAASCAPENADCHLALGEVLDRQGQSRQAIDEAKRAVALAPDHPLAAQKLAMWLYFSGAKEEAIIACKDAIRIKPVQPDPHFILASACADLSDYSNAVVHFRLAARLKPKWTAAHEQLGSSLIALKQWDEAAASFSKAIQLNPKDAGLRCQLASCFTGQGKTSAAIEAYRQALGLDPHCVPALDGLAWILATDSDPQLRNGPEAVQLATLACDLGGRQNARYLETLAAAFAEAGRFTEATTAAEQALALARSAGEKEPSGTERLVNLFRANRPYHQDASGTQ